MDTEGSDLFAEAEALIERHHAAMTPDEARAWLLSVDGAKAVVDAARKFADWRRQHGR